MNLTQLSDTIVREISDDETVSIPRVAFYLRSQVGNLNVLINTSFTIDSTTLEFSPDLTDDEAAILKEIYWIYYWNRKFQESLGSSGYTVVEVKEGDSSVRRTARTEFAKLYMQAKKEHQTLLNNMVDLYKRNRAITMNVDLTLGYPLPNNNC